mmetsp:Transcript_48606/g.157541  ORF Transcript_48606/g.157541 Transcript_48606/m.157541 type:complete len:208 (+) Transcript_48606:1020-1643(+)
MADLVERLRLARAVGRPQADAVGGGGANLGEEVDAVGRVEKVVRAALRFLLLCIRPEHRSVVHLRAVGHGELCAPSLRCLYVEAGGRSGHRRIGRLGVPLLNQARHPSDERLALAGGAEGARDEEAVGVEEGAPWVGLRLRVLHPLVDPGGEAGRAATERGEGTGGACTGVALDEAPPQAINGGQRDSAEASEAAVGHLCVCARARV